VRAPVVDGVHLAFVVKESDAVVVSGDDESTLLAEIVEVGDGNRVSVCHTGTRTRTHEKVRWSEFLLRNWQTLAFSKPGFSSSATDYSGTTDD
jgi:hypothetical protein